MVSLVTLIVVVLLTGFTFGHLWVAARLVTPAWPLCEKSPPSVKNTLSETQHRHKKRLDKGNCQDDEKTALVLELGCLAGN